MPYLLGQIGLVGNFMKGYLSQPPTVPYLLGQIGLVGNRNHSYRRLPRKSPYLLGQIGLVGNRRAVFSASDFCPLPIRSNRISWKQGGVADDCKTLGGDLTY